MNCEFHFHVSICNITLIGFYSMVLINVNADIFLGIDVFLLSLININGNLIKSIPWVFSLAHLYSVAASF